MDIDDRTIFVEQTWNGWRIAEIPVRNLHEVHWRQPAGAPRALLHGYISCGDIAADVFAHDCDRGSAPHRLLVCVLKKHCAPSTYASVAERAGASVKTVAPATTAIPVRRQPQGMAVDG